MKKDAVTSQPIHPLIAARWSPRAFGDTAIADRDLDALLEAARWAPSSVNEQPWRFVVAKREDEHHAAMVACLVESNQVWAKKAGALILSVAKLSFTRNGKPNRHAFHDVGLASAQLILEAGSRGLVAHPMGGFDPDKARATFAIPEDFEPVAVLAVGAPAEPETLPADLQERERAPRTRRPLVEVAFRGVWR